MKKKCLNCGHQKIEYDGRGFPFIHLSPVVDCALKNEVTDENGCCEDWISEKKGIAKGYPLGKGKRKW